MARAPVILDGALLAYADIPVAQCYSRLLTDLGGESRCHTQPQWKPDVVAREACIAVLRSKLQSRNKKQLLKKRNALPLSRTILAPTHTNDVAAVLGPKLVSAAEQPTRWRLSAREIAFWGPGGEPGTTSSSPDQKRKAKAEVGARKEPWKDL